MASGTDIAMEAADLVLMRPNDLMDIPAALNLTRCIFRRIKLNLAWACMYNLIGLPIAMGFLLPSTSRTQPTMPRPVLQRNPPRDSAAASSIHRGRFQNLSMRLLTTTLTLLLAIANPAIMGCT
ncbi:hypothetical protein FDECE_15446 [Fusarium decemcellulare]|nr:hypothetical protein FDECE_15446 [Fusarium decemcellulare]